MTTNAGSRASNFSISALAAERRRVVVSSTVDWNASRPALATISATFTGRSRCTTRSRKTRKRTRPEARKKPTSETPRFGAASSTCRRSVYENVSVSRSMASVALRTGSRYQIRMYLGENVPVTIWTTSTLTVTTNPSRPTVAPTTVVSTVSAVPVE